MFSSRVRAAVAWFRSHPSAETALGVAIVASLFSPGVWFTWVAVLVCGGLLLAAGTRDHGTAPIGTTSSPAPAPPRPTPVEVPVDDERLPPPPDGADATTEQLRALSDQDLCRAWRTSYVRLQRLKRNQAGTRTAVAAMAAQRARYLDELERRYPAGFAAWLAAGARAPSDPTRYLQRPAPKAQQD